MNDTTEATSDQEERVGDGERLCQSVPDSDDRLYNARLTATNLLEGLGDPKLVQAIERVLTGTTDEPTVRGRAAEQVLSGQTTQRRKVTVLAIFMGLTRCREVPEPSELSEKPLPREVMRKHLSDCQPLERLLHECVLNHVPLVDAARQALALFEATLSRNGRIVMMAELLYGDCAPYVVGVGPDCSDECWQEFQNRHWLQVREAQIGMAVLPSHYDRARYVFHLMDQMGFEGDDRVMFLAQLFAQMSSCGETLPALSDLQEQISQLRASMEHQQQRLAGTVITGIRH
ncbi:hypothetical protein HY375_01070 [Candidatus Berkelbacteria bacterium]|nr:hypothetical protein [Candidatus Berkelbacteria bacterium]